MCDGVIYKKKRGGRGAEVLYLGIYPKKKKKKKDIDEVTCRCCLVAGSSS